MPSNQDEQQQTRKQHVRYVVPYDHTDASVRERVHAWTARLGPEVVTTIETTASQQFRTLRNAQTTLVFRHANRWSQGFAEQRLLRSASFGVYELDDGLFLDNGRLPGLGAWWKPAVAKSRIALRSVKSADRVIAGNAHIAEWASRFVSDVVIVPTCVEPSRYSIHIPDAPWEVGGLVWIGSQATLPHLELISDALREVHRRTQARLTLIGPPSTPPPASIRHMTTTVDWSLQTQHKLGSFGGVGVMPLPDQPYERCKCAYKLLQYAAAGMIPVGSPVGASQTALDCFQGYAPGTTDEWVDALTEALTLSVATRKSRGAHARRAVTDHYSFERWESTYRAALLPAKSS